MKKCKNCKSIIRDNDKYCRNCGIIIPNKYSELMISFFTVAIITGIILFIILFISSYFLE